MPEASLQSTATSDEPAPAVSQLPPIFQLSDHDRCSTPFPLRVSIAVLSASLAGLGLGMIHGGQMSGLRFRAENAHRLPTSEVGWFFYHKSKNYHVMLGGLKGGFKMASKLSVWTGLFLWMEEGVDRTRGAMSRGWTGFQDRRRADKGWGDAGLERVDMPGATPDFAQRDFLSTTVAVLGTSGAFSIWHKLPLSTAAKMSKLGLKMGLAYGLVQDALGYARGRRIGYIEFFKRKFSQSRSRQQVATA